MKYFLLPVIFLFLHTSNAQLDKNLINKTIQENTDNSKFDSISKKLGYKGGDQVKVLTIFTVNQDGKIVDIKARGPHPIFENEAIRILEKVPDLVPASYNGKPVNPKFSLPITFIIETEKQKKRRLKKEKKQRKKSKN